MRVLRLRQIVGTREQPGPIPVSRSTWWAGVKEGRFPKPFKLGPRTTVWHEGDIDALIEGMHQDSLRGTKNDVS